MSCNLRFRREVALRGLAHRLKALGYASGSLPELTLAEQSWLEGVIKTSGMLTDDQTGSLEESEELCESNYGKEDFEPVHEPMEFDNGREFFSYDYIRRVLNYKDAGRGRSMKSVFRRFRRVKRPEYISRFRRYRRKQGTRQEKYQQIAQFCKESFDSARARGIPVHDRTLRSWALMKARELSVTRFKASERWIQQFKAKYRISSRKIVRFVSYRHQQTQDEIKEAVQELLNDYVRTVRTRFDPSEVFNTDQSGFNYIVHTNRTLSYTGERTTHGAVSSVNALTHSYAIQPILSMKGELVGKLYVNLQEKENQFGPRVARDLPVFENLYVTCSKSGKLTKSLVKEWSRNVFSEVVGRLHSKNCALYVDSWGGHRESELYESPEVDILVKVFPKGATSIVQPLDVYCFRQWKDFAKRLSEHAFLLDIRLDDRASVLKMQSLIFNQFQNPAFRPLWLCAWHLAGFDVPNISFDGLAAMLFKVDDDCSMPECLMMPFIRCIYCEETLCVRCFFVKYHYHSRAQ